MILTEFLRNEILKTESYINDFLLKADTGLLVKKEVDYGRSNMTLYSLEGVKAVFVYSISYTFKEDIEDERGQRPNDVSLSIVLQMDEKNNFKINREITFGAEFDDIEFDILYVNALTDDIEHKFGFNEIREAFKISIMNFISFLKM